MRNSGLEETQAGIKIAGRNINNLRDADDTTLMTESEEKRKSLLIRVKEENEKADLKLSIKNTKIMASSPTTSWEIVGEKVETVKDFIFLGSRITADSDCIPKIKKKKTKTKNMFPWKESCDKPRQHIKKQRHHFADKCLYSQSDSFSSNHV